MNGFCTLSLNPGLWNGHPEYTMYRPPAKSITVSTIVHFSVGIPLIGPRKLPGSRSLILVAWRSAEDSRRPAVSHCLQLNTVHVAAAWSRPHQQRTIIRIHCHFSNIDKSNEKQKSDLLEVYGYRNGMQRHRSKGYHDSICKHTACIFRESNREQGY